MLIGASGLPGFWSVFGLFDVFFEDFNFSRGLAGGRGHTVHTNSSRRTHPRYPGASTNYFPFENFQKSTFFGPLGQGPWAHGPGSMEARPPIPPV